MKSPICAFDAKSGVLCSKCETKLSNGQISKDDVKASIILSRLAEKNPDINKFTLLRAAFLDNDVVLVLRPSDVAIARNVEGLSRKIEDELNGRVWFLESESSDRGFVETLLYPSRVLTVNLFWLPDGSKLTKVIVAGTAEKTKINVQKVSKIAKAVRNMDLMLEFES